jgi:peptide deformylase
MAEQETLQEDNLEEPPAPPAELDDVEVEREEGAPTVAELDPETRARRDAALRHVRKFGDPVLRASAVPVDRFDNALKYRAFPEDPVTVLVNPVLEWKSEETEVGEEGCLSLPGVHVEVERAASVRVRAQEETGSEREIEAEGLAARIIQHEMDHLDGVLILDHISREARKEAMRAMREAIEGRTRKDAPAANGVHPSDDGQPAAGGADAGDADGSAADAGAADASAA